MPRPVGQEVYLLNRSGVCSLGSWSARTRSSTRDASSLQRLRRAMLCPPSITCASNAEAGGPDEHGSGLTETYHQVGAYTARIRRARNPPTVVQSTKFDFVVNLPTPRALGLTVRRRDGSPRPPASVYWKYSGGLASGSAGARMPPRWCANRRYGKTGQGAEVAGRIPRTLRPM